MCAIRLSALVSGHVCPLNPHGTHTITHELDRLVKGCAVQVWPPLGQLASRQGQAWTLSRERQWCASEAVHDAHTEATRIGAGRHWCRWFGAEERERARRVVTRLPGRRVKG